MKWELGEKVREDGIIKEEHISEGFSLCKIHRELGF